MKYPVYLQREIEQNHYQVKVPDLPGCQLIADTVDQAFFAIKETIASHLSILAEYGETIPHGKSIEFYQQQITGNVIWTIVDLDITPYLGKSHKINVTLPELLIKQIDDRVSKSPEYKSRSGFIAQACINELTK